LRVLADSSALFARRFVRGIEVDREQLATNIDRSLLAVTALNPILGYDRVAQVTATALHDRITPRAAAIALGFLDGDQYDRLVDPARLVAGNVSRQ
jgi:fumarate hydratase class II